MALYIYERMHLVHNLDANNSLMLILASQHVPNDYFTYYTHGHALTHTYTQYTHTYTHNIHTHTHTYVHRAT